MWCVCVLISTCRGVFIGVQGGVTDLVKSVTHQVVIGRNSHVAGRPCGSSSTDILDNVDLPLLMWTCVHHPLGPLVSSLCTLPPRVRYIPGVTLILVKFQISL
jgi:hypothetical protein